MRLNYVGSEIENPALIVKHLMVALRQLYTA